MSIKPPLISQKAIIERAERLINEFVQLRGGKHNVLMSGLCFDRVYEEVIYPNYGIEIDESKELGDDDEGKKILGYYEPFANKAYVDVSLRDDPRRTFTRWHEVGGHGILQGDWLRKEGSKTRIVTTEEDISPIALDVLERQANIFAAHAVAPSWLVNGLISRLFRPSIALQGFNALYTCRTVWLRNMVWHA